MVRASANGQSMTIRIMVATLAATLVMGSVAWADNAAGNQVSQATTTTVCTPAKDPPRPLSIWMTPQGIFPLTPAQFGAAMRGSCVTTPDYVPGTQPFLGAYPYPGSYWIFGVSPPQQYRGT